MIQLNPSARYDTGSMTTFDRAPLVDTFGEMARRYAQQRKELEDQHTDALGSILAKNQRALSPQEVAKRKMRIDELNGQLAHLIQDEAISKEDPNGELQLGITDHSAEKKRIQDEINQLENFEGNIQNENEASRLEYDSGYARDKMRYAPKTTRNLDAISQSIGNGLQALRSGQAILQQAKTAEKTQLPQLKADYDVQYNAWQESLVNASEADATSQQLHSIGRLPTFEEFLRGEQKQEMSAKEAEIRLKLADLGLSKARIDLEISKGTFGNLGLQKDKLAQELANTKTEGVSKQANASVANVEASKKESERPVQLAKMAGVINKIASIANNITNAKDEAVRKNQSNLLLTYASKEAMGALSGEEFQNMIATSGANWEQIVNKFSPFANLRNAPPEIALVNGKQLYDGLKSEYSAILGSLTPQERKYVKSGINPFPSSGGNQSNTKPIKVKISFRVLTNAVFSPPVKTNPPVTSVFRPFNTLSVLLPVSVFDATHMASEKSFCSCGVNLA